MTVSPDVTVVIDYSCAYLLAILGPLVPAILIYKLFPDTKVSVSGPLAGLTLKTGGAFAIYVATFAMATFIVMDYRSALDASLTVPTYRVSGKIDFVDSDGKPITDPRVTDGLTVEYSPRLFELDNSDIYFTLPVDNKGNTNVYLSLGERGRVPLAFPFTDHHAVTSGREITLKDTVHMTVNTTPYNPNGTPPTQGESR